MPRGAAARPRLIVRADLQRWRALARHHHDLRAVRRHGARPAGLRSAATFRLRGLARHRPRRSACSRSSGPSSRRCCSRAALAPRSRPRSGSCARPIRSPRWKSWRSIRCAMSSLPRFLGGVIAMPLLTGMFIAIGLFGAQLVGVQLIGVDAGAFWSQMRGTRRTRRRDGRCDQGCVFGVACSLIAVLRGLSMPRRRPRASVSPRRAPSSRPRCSR